MNDAYSFQLCYVLQPKVYLLYVGKCSMQTSGEHVFWCCWIEYSVNGDDIIDDKDKAYFSIKTRHIFNYTTFF